MLQAMRSGTKSPIMKAFLLFLAGGFAIWGIGDVSNGLFGSGDKAVEAGSQSVSIYEAANEFELIRRSSQSNMNIGQALQVGLLEDVMGQLSRKTVFAAEADALRLDVTREMLTKAVAQETAFQNELGEFAEGRFLQILAQNGFTEETYLMRLKDALLAQQLVESISDGGTYSQGLSGAIARFQLEERTAKILRFDVRPDDVATPDADILASWYEENKSAYDAPALRDIEVLNLTAAALAPTIILSEEDVQLAYDTRSEEFITPERRTVRQMVFSSQENAEAALAKIEDISQFNDVAAEMLNWTESDVSLGEVAQNDLDADFADAVFAADTDTLIGPVQTAFGYNLAVVDAIAEGGQQTFEDVREQIETSLRTEKSFIQLFDNVNAVEDSLGAGASLSEAAASIGVDVQLVAGISSTGLTIDGDAYTGPVSDLASDSTFLIESWETEIGETSVIIEAGIDNYFIVRPVSETDSRARDLSEVSRRATDDWKREKAVEAARLQGEAALSEGDVAFADSTETGKFQRNGAGLDDAAARLIAQAAFGQKMNDSQIVETGEAALVVKTVSVQNAAQDAVDDFTTNLASTFDQMVRNDIGTALAIHLSDKHGLQTYPEPVRQILISQGN